MSIRDIVRQVKPVLEKNSIDYTYFIQDLLSEQAEFPSEVFDGFPFEKDSKRSSSRRTVFIVRSNDRDNDRDEIGRRLKQQGIIYNVVPSSYSSFDPIEATHDGNKFLLLFKAASGGMAETTLNSSITELFPCIAYETNYTPKSPKDFIEYLVDLDVTKLKCVNPKDAKAADETIAKAEDSSKFDEKMKNAICVTKYIRDTNKDKPVKNVFWGYRAKPPGVPSNHPGDIFLQFSDNAYLGVSLKAGGKKTSEPQLNTYVNPMFKSFRAERQLQTLRSTAYAQIYSKIKGMPPVQSFDGGKGGRDKNRKVTEKLLVDLNKKNNRLYEKYYDQYLEIMRSGVISLFNQNKKNSLEYIKTEVLRDAPDVPTIVIKAISDSYEEVTDLDELGVFLPQVRFVKAYASKGSKQNWFIELKSGSDTVTMKMSIRTNKAGNAGVKKLGQFNLAIKYNGLSK